MSYIVATVLLLIAALIGVGGFYVKGLINADDLRSAERQPYLAKRRKQAIPVFLTIAIILLGVNTLYRGVMQVDPGEGGVLVWFGNLQQSSVPTGLSLVNPMADRYTLSVMRRTIDFTDDRQEGNAVNPVNGPAVLVTTKDHNLLRINVSVPYALNPKYLPILFEKVGRTNDLIETKLLETNVRSALVDTASKNTWRQIMADGRAKVIKGLHTSIKSAIAKDLMNYGVPEEVAGKVLMIASPQIRQVTPSDKVKAAVDEAAATKVLRDRQEDLNAIAAMKVKRRELEGQAIEQMFAKLPKGSTSLDIHRVLSAVAAKERADALMKAVEQNKVSVIFMGGESNNVSPALAMSGK